MIKEKKIKNYSGDKWWHHDKAYSRSYNSTHVTVGSNKSGDVRNYRKLEDRYLQHSKRQHLREQIILNPDLPYINNTPKHKKFSHNFSTYWL